MKKLFCAVLFLYSSLATCSPVLSNINKPTINSIVKYKYNGIASDIMHVSPSGQISCDIKYSKINDAAYIKNNAVISLLNTAHKHVVGTVQQSVNDKSFTLTFSLPKEIIDNIQSISCN